MSAASAGKPRHWGPDFLLLAAIWGSSFLFMRWGVVEFGPLPTAGVRVAIAAFFLLPLVGLPGPFLILHGRTRATLPTAAGPPPR